ncbi:MAG: methyltransferase domain-containing protein [Rhodanobacter sp.]
MNADTEIDRKPHVSEDLPSRNLKAVKIERLLGLADRPPPIRILEVGTGSGGIAHYFGTHPVLHCDVDAVDIHDNRVVVGGYRYHAVYDTKLPFADQSFDVVITNHVIEHVGDASTQSRHLAEIRRVLKTSGVGYLAVPNRWMLTEPHFKLRFLSWLPRSWRSPYLRMMRKGDVYDCEPLQMRQLERMLDAAGFCYRNVCVEAWRVTLEIEQPRSLAAQVMRATPDGVLAPFRRIIPTLIYRLEPRSV